jgi:hypothetical protein
MALVPPEPRHMQRACLRATLLGLCVCLTQPVLAADWQSVGTDADGNRYSVDAAGTTRDGDLVRVQVRTEYVEPRDDPASGKSIFVALDSMVVDCAKASFAIEYREYVAADGSLIPVFATPRENLDLRAAAEGSMSEAIVRSVCRSAAAKR